MKYFQQTVDFDYSWEEVSTNNWRKYCPWNDKAEHVIGGDVLNRVLDHETGIVSLTTYISATSPRALLTENAAASY